MANKRDLLEALANKRVELRTALRLINRFGQQKPGQQQSLQLALRGVTNQIKKKSNRIRIQGADLMQPDMCIEITLDVNQDHPNWSTGTNLIAANLHRILMHMPTNAEVYIQHKFSE